MEDVITENLLKIHSLRKGFPIIADAWNIARELSGKLPVFITKSPLNIRWETHIDIYERESLYTSNMGLPIMNIIITGDGLLRTIINPTTFDNNDKMIKLDMNVVYPKAKWETSFQPKIQITEFEMIDELYNFFIEFEKHF